MLPMVLGPYCTKPVAVGAVDGIAQALDYGILQGTCELAFQLHLREFSPFGRLLELLRGDRLGGLLLRDGSGGAGDDNRCC